MARLNRLKTQGQRTDVSKGEKDVGAILKQIFKFAQFYYEYPYSRFTNTDNERLRADIYCSSFNFAIEFQGQHHYEPVFYGSTEEDIQKAMDSFKERQRLDTLKKKLCEDAEVKLLEISTFEWSKLGTDDEKREYLMGLL